MTKSPSDVVRSAIAAEKRFLALIDGGEDFELRDLFAEVIINERSRCRGLAKAWSAWGSVTAERIAVAIERGEVA